MTQTAVKERGIIFTAWSIPKVMDGTKTQTRRTWGLEFVNIDPNAYEFLRMEGDMAVFKQIRFSMTQIEPRIPRNSFPKLRNSYRNAGEIPFTPIASFPKKMEGVDPNVLFYIKCPYGQVGNRLWVRETHFIGGIKPKEWAWYKADFNGDINAVVWRPSIFMPHWASRIDLEITEVRAERLQDISPHKLSTTNLEREGIPWKNRFGKDFTTELERYVLLEEFKEFWDSLNPRYPFDFNPWVWPIGFKLIKEAT